MTKLQKAKQAYDNHRDECNTCNPSGLCDKGYELAYAIKDAQDEEEWDNEM